jgi:hypothetical protein
MIIKYASFIVGLYILTVSRQELRAAETYPKRNDGRETRNAATHILVGIELAADLGLSAIGLQEMQCSN